MFMLYFGIVLCFIPLLAALLIVTLKFKCKITHMLIAVLMGLVAVIPISVIQYFIPDFSLITSNPILHTMIKSILLYGLIEELVKMVLILPLPKKDYDLFNFLLMAFVMGISIGCFESIVYYLDHLQMAYMRGAEPLYSIILLRIFSSDVIHLTCTGLCGLCVYTMRNKPFRISCFINAFLIHGVYDFFAGFQNGFRWFAIPVILLAIIEVRQKYVSVQNLCENRLTIFY